MWRASASPDGRPIACPRWRSRAASEWYASSSTSPVICAGRLIRLAGRRPSIRFDRCAGGWPGRSNSSHQSSARSGVTRPKPIRSGNIGSSPLRALIFVPVPDLAVAVAEGGVGELERDVRLAVQGVIARPVVGQLVGELLADQHRQEVAQQDPLVVPHRRAPRLLEDLGLGDAVLAQPVDDRVVRVQEDDVELVDEEVHVVARVADQREPSWLRGTSLPSSASRSLAGSSRW